jgi:hypothetical protein
MLTGQFLPTLEPQGGSTDEASLAVRCKISVGCFCHLSPRYKGGNVTYGLTNVTYVFGLPRCTNSRDESRTIRYICQTIRY